MDRRIVKTRSSLVEAMIRCSQTTSWDELSIQQICDEADIARSTFYLHFRNKAELLDFSFGFLEQELVRVPQTRSLDRDDAFGFLPALLQFIAAEDHSFLFTRTDAPAMMHLVSRRLREIIAAMVGTEFAACPRHKDTPRALRNFIVGGIFNALEDWHLSDDKLPAQETLSSLDMAIGKLLRP